jgi:predicted acetyltransferase
MEEFNYNCYGRMMTGFDNSIEHSMYGHWSNHEYQEDQQLASMMPEEYEAYLAKKEDQPAQDQPSSDWVPL